MCHFFFSGWSGVNCEVDINECNVTNVPEPCVHGMCVNTPGSFHCDCSGSGYHGLIHSIYYSNIAVCVWACVRACVYVCGCVCG